MAEIIDKSEENEVRYMDLGIGDGYKSLTNDEDSEDKSQKQSEDDSDYIS